MAFTNNWFKRSIPCMNALSATEKYSERPISILEIGAYEGNSTVWFLENILTHNDSTITSIDMCPQDTCMSNIKGSRNAHKHTLIIERSQTALFSLVGRKFDLVYVDGSHFPDDILRDSVIAFELLAVGGVIVYDDYLNHTDRLLYLSEKSRADYYRLYNTRMNSNRLVVNSKSSYLSLGVIHPSDGINFFVHAYAPIIDCVYADNALGVRAYKKLGNSYDEHIIPTYI